MSHASFSLELGIQLLLSLVHWHGSSWMLAHYGTNLSAALTKEIITHFPCYKLIPQLAHCNIFFSRNRVDIYFNHDKVSQSLSWLRLDNSKHQGVFYYWMVFCCLSAQYLNVLLKDPEPYSLEGHVVSF